MTTIDELYCNIDDFNQVFYPEWEKTLLESGDKKRRRQGVMSPGGGCKNNCVNAHCGGLSQQRLNEQT